MDAVKAAISSLGGSVEIDVVHRERIDKCRMYLVLAMATAIVFLVVQFLGMNQLLNVHLETTDGSHKAYGLCYTLALIHALHVMGGVGYILYVLIQSFRNRYDHERHWAIDYCGGYWHFLDVVWISMLVTFWITR